MAKKSLVPEEVAFWRFQQIEEALDKKLTHDERGKIVRCLCKPPVRWPSGKTKRITTATAYRWIRQYFNEGLEGLHPKRRSDLGATRAQLPEEVVQHAIRLLTDDPGVSLTFLLTLLRPQFPKVTISRSTLHQRLKAHPDYKQLKRSQRYKKQRTRFVAKAPHLIWQTDAKGPVTIKLENKTELKFHVISILDDSTRAILAAIVTKNVDLGAAVKVLRMAVNRWNAPEKLYADRASIFDAHAFRMGLAQLGSYRIPTKARDPETRGKIEAYHRTLVLWFTDRLQKQVVVDLVHLQQLLDGVIHSLYQPHTHRGIKISPIKALNGVVSNRSIPPARLVDAFRQKRKLKAHPKTGEVELAGVTYLVPDELRGQRLVFLLDPPNEHPPLVEHPTSGNPLSLRRAAIKPEDLDFIKDPPKIKRWGMGNLQTLYDNWQGKTRPYAEPGFGLPEIYKLLGEACGRHVPGSDAEALLIQTIYAQIGPLPQRPTQDAFDAITRQLGSNRPIKTYLDEIKKRVVEISQKKRN